MGIPLPALSIRPPEQPDYLGALGKVLGIKSAQNQQQLQQGQIQGQQQQLQSGNIDLQLKQQQLKNATVTNSFLSDPKAMDDYKAWQKSQAPATATTGGTPTTTNEFPVPLHPLAQYLAEQKGLPLYGPGGALEVSDSLTKAAQSIATLQKTQGETATTNLTNHGKQLDNFDQLAEPILSETDPAKQAQGLADLRTEIQAHPDLYPPEATQHLDKLNSVQALQQGFNTSQLRQMVIEEGTKKAGMVKAGAEAKTSAQAAAAPTPAQISTAANTLATYAAVPPNMRAGLTAEMKAAPTYDALQKVQARADAANESFQRSADARTQASALKDVGLQEVVAGKLVTEDQKLGSALDQTSGIRAVLDMSKGGNEVATAAAQTRFAEHEIVEGGVKRMNQVEYQNLATSLGDYGRRFSAWADKGFKGQMPPATNAEMAKILDAEDQVANTAHERNVGFIMNRYAPGTLRGGAGASGAPQGGTPSFRQWKAAQGGQ